MSPLQGRYIKLMHCCEELPHICWTVAFKKRASCPDWTVKLTLYQETDSTLLWHPNASYSAAVLEVKSEREQEQAFCDWGNVFFMLICISSLQGTFTPSPRCVSSSWADASGHSAGRVCSRRMEVPVWVPLAPSTGQYLRCGTRQICPPLVALGTAAESAAEERWGFGLAFFLVAFTLSLQGKRTHTHTHRVMSSVSRMNVSSYSAS